MTATTEMDKAVLNMPIYSILYYVPLPWICDNTKRDRPYAYHCCE